MTAERRASSPGDAAEPVAEKNDGCKIAVMQQAKYDNIG
jgi:hypothetical protein